MMKVSQLKQLINGLLLAVITAMLFSGCYYDTEEELYSGDIVCDTASVTYSTTIKPLVDGSCTSCHSGSAASGNIDLTTYAGIKAQADNGAFYGAIAHADGFSPMPQGGNKLSDCLIAKVKHWIDQGAPQN
jgi:hypothetical protein